jgi:hypothetical protein
VDAWLIVALLGSVIVVYAWIFIKKHPAEDSTGLLAEIDDTLQGYVSEIVDSNRHVIDQVERLKKRMDEERREWLSRIGELERQLAELRKNAPAPSEKIAEPSARPAPSNAHIHERYHDLIELKRQGLSTDEIVKRTGMNHGEVQFILQLASQEETRS